MYTGPGAAPMLAAAAAWDALAADLELAAVGYSEVISSLIGHQWSGRSYEHPSGARGFVDGQRVRRRA